MDEADDLDALLAAVPASPATDADSDEDLAMLLDLVAAGESLADRYRQRGPLLCRMMRGREALLADLKLGKVPTHMQRLIQTHNEDFAETALDIIDLVQRTPLHIRGQGQYQRWTVEALQRACWGLRVRPRMTKKASGTHFGTISYHHISVVYF